MWKGSQKIDNSIVILEDGQRKKDKIKLKNQKGKLVSLLFGLKWVLGGDGVILYIILNEWYTYYPKWMIHQSTPAPQESFPLK